MGTSSVSLQVHRNKINSSTYGEYHSVPLGSSVDLIRYFVCKNPCSFSEEQKHDVVF